MSYPNFIGEFVAPLEKDDWPNYVRWNERRPVLTRGALNPWEVERVRYLWEQEKAAWAKIVPLKNEYKDRENQIKRDISIFNDHLAEIERITKKKIGLGAGGKYFGMYLSILPGFGWFSAAFSIASMGLEMLMGNKKKKRIAELTRILEEAQARMVKNQQRLGAIQGELKLLMDVTIRAKSEIEAKKQADTQQTRYAQQLYDEQRNAQHLMIDQELARVRQISPNRVVYGNEL